MMLMILTSKASPACPFSGIYLRNHSIYLEGLRMIYNYILHVWVVSIFSCWSVFWPTYNEAVVCGDTDPEHKALQKFNVFLTFPVTTCVHSLPSEVTNPPRSSIICASTIKCQQCGRRLCHIALSSFSQLIVLLTNFRKDLTAKSQKQWLNE